MSFLLRNNNNSKAPTAAPDIRPSLSQEAASIGQRILDLEADLDAHFNRANEAENKVSILMSECDDLRDKLNKAETDKDYFQHRWIETQSKLKSAAGIILDAMRDDVRGRFRPRPDSLRAVEEAISPADDGEKPPAFLAAGPRQEEEPT